MIYLIAGVPGAGKTAFTISELITNLHGRRIITINIKWTDKGREKINNLVDLGVHTDYIIEGEENINEFKEYKYVEQPVDNTLQKGDVLIIDEAQKFFPQRTAGKDVPPMLASLETHRRLGVDLVFISQNPKFLDVHVRRLTSYYYWLERPYGIHTKVYKFQGYPEQINDFTKKNADTQRIRYKKNTFELYKSTELNTQKRTLAIPKIMGLIALLTVLMLLLLYLWYFFSKKTEKHEIKEIKEQQKQPEITSGEIMAEKEIETGFNANGYKYQVVCIDGASRMNGKAKYSFRLVQIIMNEKASVGNGEYLKVSAGSNKSVTVFSTRDETIGNYFPEWDIKIIPPLKGLFPMSVQINGIKINYHGVTCPPIQVSN
jgi:hypothetical protein